MAGWEAVNYSREDIMRMQQDAERRVRDMQRKAERAVMRGTIPPPAQTQPIESPVVQPEHHAKVAEEIHTKHNEPMQETAPPEVMKTTAPRMATEMPPTASPPPRQNPQRNFHHPYQAPPPQPRQRPASSPIQNVTAPIKNIGNMLGGLLGKDSGGFQNVLSGFLKDNREDTPIGKVMSALNLDSEKLILIFLILVLLNDGADYTLILALGYILL